MQKAIIYSRFSPRPNAAECESIETQAEYCRKYALEHKYEVQGEYEDRSMSGADEDRPGLWRAVDELKRGWVLLAYNHDRIARSVFLSEYINREVEKKGASIEVVTGCMNGKSDENVMIRQVLQSFAEYTRKAMAARTKAAMLRHQDSGRRMSSRTPYGWTQDFDKEAHAKAQAEQGIMTPRAWLKPCPEEQEIIKYIQELRKSGLGYHGIANRLMAEDKPCRGGKWFHTTIKAILKRA